MGVPRYQHRGRVIAVLRRIRHHVTDALLWLVAGMGLLAIILVIAAYLFNTSVILFRTGSMEPTVPTGSAALVQEIPASEVEVGDILTVERPDQLPVTHRVISVEPGDTPQERVITMQGDANASPDANPYRITEGKVLRGSVPGMAKVIHQLGNPYVLGGITLAAAILVGWAFWPRSSTLSDAPDQQDQDTPTEGNQADSSKTPPHHLGAVIGFLTAAATAGLMPLTPVAEASTTDLVEETVSSQYITLTSTYAPATREALTKDSISPWDIGIDIEAPSEGEARAGLQAQGDFALRVSVLACSIQWTDSPTASAQGTASCDGVSRTVAENLIISPNEAPQWIDHFQTSDSPWLRLLVSLPPEGANQPEGTTGLRLDVEAAGDELSVDSDVHTDGHSTESSTSPAQDLARTGGPVILLLVVALASMTLGRWVQSRSAQKTGNGR